MIQEKVLDEVVAYGRVLERHLADDYDLPYRYVAAMLTCMHAAGWRDMSYETLIVESGVGLSFGYKRNACVPMYALQGGAPERIAAATGFQVDRTTLEDLEQAWRWVKGSIDQGLPVAAEYAEFHVVAGYREGSGVKERHWFVLGNEPISPASGDWLTWQQIAKLHRDCPWSKYRFRYGGKADTWLPQKTAKRVMEWLVEWSASHPGRDNELYQGSTFGLEAIEAYARDVGDMSLTVERDFQWGNNACHAITPQWNTRRYIGAYLERKASLFDDAARPYVQRAAELYGAAHMAWIRFDEQLGQRFVRKYGGDQAEGWADEERRKKGSDAIYEALQHEKAAIEEVRRALGGLQDHG